MWTIDIEAESSYAKVIPAQGPVEAKEDLKQSNATAEPSGDTKAESSYATVIPAQGPAEAKEEREQSNATAEPSGDTQAESSNATVIQAQSPAEAKEDLKQSNATAKPSGQAVTLNYDQVSERARAIWLKSGCVPGRDDANWREAEAQLKAELGIN